MIIFYVVVCQGEKEQILLFFEYIDHHTLDRNKLSFRCF